MMIDQFLSYFGYDNQTILFVLGFAMIAFALLVIYDKITEYMNDRNKPRHS